MSDIIEPETNSRSARRATLNASHEAAMLKLPNETRWYYGEYGYRLGLLAGCLGTGYLHWWVFWGSFIHGFVMAIIVMILVIICSGCAGLLLGGFAALVDRGLQELGWRESHQAIELER